MALVALAGRVAIVTGASSGIGRAACVALAAQGARVVAVGRDPARLAATAGAARAAGGTEVLTLALDVRSEAQMQDMAARTLDRFGRIDILLHCAGILRAAGTSLRPLAQLPSEDWDEVVDINLRGTFLANRAVLPAMLAAGRGDILNLSSKSGRAGIAFDAPYCASKFGVEGLSQVLAEEAAPQGVRVQVLAPGIFDTEVLQQTGPLLPLVDIPPPQRVVDLIGWMLALPQDTRLLGPVVEPVQRGSGWTAARPRTLVSKPEEKTMTHSLPSSARDLRGKVAIITGGTGGIGLATARTLAGLGAKVVVADLDPARVAEVAAQVGQDASEPHSCLGIAIDVRREEDHARMVQATLDAFGRIDALIACAGILRKRGTPPKLLIHTDLEEWDDVIGINLKGVFLANRAVLPTMIAQRSGTIINLSSVQGLQGRAYDGVYCASKFGVIGLSQAVADEVRSYGIRVQALMPAAVATPMWEQNLPAPMPGDAIAPERVADLIAFMLLQPDDTMIVAPVIAPVGARKRKVAGKPAATA